MIPHDTVDGCEILHQLIGGKHPIILIGFQPSFWWCRISSINSRYLYKWVFLYNFPFG